MKYPMSCKVVILVTVVLLFDQMLKIWVKTNMFLGQEFSVFENWFLIRFVENPGMAFGFEFGGKVGKIFLNIFRLIFIAIFIYFIRKQIRKKAPQGFIICVSLILAGAIGNLIDGALFGLIFDSGTTFNTELGIYVGYSGVSQLSNDGYAPFLHGCVVDMFFFPLIETTYPDWFPFMAGKSFVFFRPVFNIADIAVTSGTFSLILFQKSYLKTIANCKEIGQLIKM